MDGYSRMIGWLKVILPLVALGILSTLFLLSRVSDPGNVIPFAEKEIQERLRDQQVTGPVYRGITSSGDEITFSAQKITRPDGSGGSNKAEDVEIRVKTASGNDMLLTANQGDLNLANDAATLSAGVTLNTATGYQITSNTFITQLSTLNVTSPGPVAANGPPGTLNAGAMQLTNGTDDTGAQLLFTDGVKLVYTPKKDLK